ncbi:MAG: hypothetical protein R2942_04860 [Ignavibacteria bacterium]
MVYDLPPLSVIPNFFSEEDLMEVQNKFFDTLINTSRFYDIYSGLTEFEFSRDSIMDLRSPSCY